MASGQAENRNRFICHGHEHFYTVVAIWESISGFPILVGAGLSERSFWSQHENMYLFILQLLGRYLELPLGEYLYILPFLGWFCFQGFSSQRIAKRIHVLSSVISMVAPTWCHGPN